MLPATLIPETLAKILKMSYPKKIIGNSYVITSIAIDSQFLVNERLEDNTSNMAKT